MPWNRKARLARQFRTAGIAVAIALSFLVARSADEKELTIVTSQDHFPVPVQQREGKEYVDLQNILPNRVKSLAGDYELVAIRIFEDCHVAPDFRLCLLHKFDTFGL